MITVDDFQKMVALATKTVTERADEFSRLDAALGDGDHGEAISTAMKIVEKEAMKGGDFKNMLNNMGFGVMLETSGSTSTLLGALFMGMSDGVPADVKELSADNVRAMFQSGLKNIQMNTKAKIGDKTMMDAVIPAIEAIQKAPGEDCKAILQAGADAALKGAESTIALKANFGRARNLGDKTIGHPDAGATSWASIFESFAKAL